MVRRERYADRQTDVQMVYRQIGGRTDGQTDIWTERQAGWQTGRLTCMRMDG